MRVGCVLLMIAATVACAPPESGSPDKDDPLPPASGPAEAVQWPFVNVPAIAGKDEATVRAALGEPSSVDTVREANRELLALLFRGDTIEVVFVGGRADWITVTAPLPMGTQALAALGIPHMEPTVRTMYGDMVRWEDQGGFREIGVARGASPDTAHYAYVWVNSKP